MTSRSSTNADGRMGFQRGYICLLFHAQPLERCSGCARAAWCALRGVRCETTSDAKDWSMLAVTPQLLPVFLRRDIRLEALKHLCLMTTPSAAAFSPHSVTHRFTEVYTFPRQPECDNARSY